MTYPRCRRALDHTTPISRYMLAVMNPAFPKNEAATAVNNCSLVLTVVRLFMHGNGKQDPDKDTAPEGEAAP